MPSQTSNAFFSKVGTQNMPEGDTRVQPWKEFHEPREELLKTGSVEVEIPSTDATGLHPFLSYNGGILLC